jgi:hypothetical protein
VRPPSTHPAQDGRLALRKGRESWPENSWPFMNHERGGFRTTTSTEPLWAHSEREDGRRSPQRRFSRLAHRRVRYPKEDLDRAFFSSRFSRTLDSLWAMRQAQSLEGLYGEEGLAKRGRQLSLWLAAAESLTLEYAGETLSRYDVQSNTSLTRASLKRDNETQAIGDLLHALWRSSGSSISRRPSVRGG